MDPGSAALRDIVDVGRYPVNQPTSREYNALAQRCRADLASSGVSILQGFVHSSAVDRLVTEAAAQATFGYASDVLGTPYLEVPSDDWPHDHPRSTWGHTRLTATAYDRIAPQAALRQLYESPVILQFLIDALGFEIFTYDDPLGGLNMAAMYDGDELFWHFDQTDFVVSLAIQSSNAGGDFECIQRIRNEAQEHYDDVNALLNGDNSRVTTLAMQPGTLMLFEGRYSIHRVSPIHGTTPRYVGLFGYDRKPGTCSSALLREIRYGRNA